jgi:hypothetical protein
VAIDGTLATANLVQGNYIGLDVNGTVPLGNAGNGVLIQSSAGNTIGGTTAEARNLISANGGSAVFIVGATASDNQVQGNIIGLDITGTISLGNTGSGVLIQSAPRNTIGGTTAAARNVISSNAENGIGIYGVDASDNRVQGNYIGTDITGTQDRGNGYSIPNNFAGVYVGGSLRTIIGGETTGAGNVISGNDYAGIFMYQAVDTQIQANHVGTNASGTSALGNSGSGIIGSSSHRTIVGGTNPAARNIISGNDNSPDAAGIWFVFDSNDNQVLGNFIGVDVTGTLPLGNRTVGVVLGGSRNIVGGTVPGARNVISDNAVGVLVVKDDNVVQGNYIGVDVTGTIPFGNREDGVRIAGGNRNTIGGTTSSAPNIISASRSHGIRINFDPNEGEATENIIQGNYIGTDVSGNADLGNTISGVYIEFTSSNLIGGDTSGAGNVISGNDQNGVFVLGAESAANRIQGNYIGTNASGTESIGNSLHGVRIDQAPRNVVGGSKLTARNVISGNAGNGVLLVSTEANQIQGNLIGTDVSGNAPRGNGIDGVSIVNAYGNTIGGTLAAERNILSANVGDGISLSESSENRILGNFIGTNVSGTSVVPNESDGIQLDDSPNNFVGGAEPGAGNTIAGNLGSGIVVTADAGAEGGGNAVQGNFIGTNKDGAQLGNLGHGILINRIENSEQKYHILRLSVPNAAGTQAWGINNNGVISGAFYDASGNYHGFLRDPLSREYTLIDFPGAVASGFWGLNDLGDAVGDYFDASGGYHSFLLDSEGTFTTIDVPFADTHETIAFDVNNDGTIL